MQYAIGILTPLFSYIFIPQFYPKSNKMSFVQNCGIIRVNEHREKRNFIEFG